MSLEKFTVDIVALPMPQMSGYDHPTGIALLPNEDRPIIITSPAGNHAPLYQAFLRQFPDFRPEGGTLLTDPSLVALGWQRKTDNHPVIIPNVNHLKPEQQTVANLAARALSLTLSRETESPIPDQIPRSIELSLQALHGVVIDRQHRQHSY